MRIGVDIGGTFTDVVAARDDGVLITTKSPSTPEDPSIGVIDGLTLLSQKMDMTLTSLLDRTRLLIHGTTVATNCLAERKGAHVGLITTRGFRDILELREGTKSDRYDLHQAYPQPLINRRDRYEVTERVQWNGQVLTKLDEHNALAQIERLRDRSVQAVVVGFLHSHKNAAHELRVRELIQESGWDVYTVLSHEILCCEGEYDRLSTAAVNAYVGPRLSTYLERLARRLKETGADFPLMIMQSTGGLLPVNEACRYAVGCVTSGPAGGAMASALFARLGAMESVITYDTGGTTSDISLIESYRPVERRQTVLQDVKIAVPSIDIQVAPLGGGSVARIDSGGILTLGPDSAGADPGPACYGRGGTSATLTDANLLLGHLSPDTFLGGRMSLRKDMAEQAIRDNVADPLGITVEEASLAIYTLASSRIAESLRVVALRRGVDLRDLTLLSFGGAGGAHTAQVARELSIPKALVPREASVFSALGFLSADIRLDGQHPFGKLLTDVKADELPRVFAQLEEHLRQKMQACGYDQEHTKIVRYLDCRYRRQTSTLEIPVPDDLVDVDIKSWLTNPFEARYKQYYGHVHKGEPPFIELCRVCAFGRVTSRNEVRPADGYNANSNKPSAFTGKRRIFVGEWIEVPVHWFDDLNTDTRLEGPAIVESPTTSIVIPAGCFAYIDAFGSLGIQKENQS